MNSGEALPLFPLIDELETLPEVESFEDLIQGRSAGRFCFLPGSTTSVNALFPEGATSFGGDIDGPTWWNEDVAALRALWVFRLKNVFYFPDFGVVLSASGGVYGMSAQQAMYGSPDLLALPFTYSRSRATVFQPSNVKRSLERAAVTMPWGGMHNYGHFVLDCLPGAATLGAAPIVGGIYPLVFPGLRDWQRRHLQLLDLPFEELRERSVQIEDLLFTSCMASFLYNPNTAYLDVTQRQLQKLAPIEPSTGRRIYLSRDGNPKRICLNETSLKGLLVGLGFEVLQPESLTVDEQISAFREAEAIVGHTGAAFANALYCSRDALVVEIQPRGMFNWWVRKICAIVGCRHAAYFCASTELVKDHPEAGLEFNIDVEQFGSFLRGCLHG